MAKTKTFHVRNGRIFFSCPFCQYRRMMAVGPSLRRRMIQCPKCGERVSCVFNRRQLERNSQKGKIFLLIDNSQIEVDLYDISENGVGFELGIRSAVKLTVGREIGLRCSWNPRLFKHGRYVIKSVKGIKVGAEYRK